jgi:hypothetical protein
MFLKDWGEGEIWPTHCIITLQILGLCVEIFLKYLTQNVVNRCWSLSVFTIM